MTTEQERVVRRVDQDAILDLVVCAEDYGHWNNVCMYSLYEFAKPISDSDIKRYVSSLSDKGGYSDKDRTNAAEKLTAWRNKYNV